MTTRTLTLFISLLTIAAVAYVMAPAASPLTAPKSSVAPRSSADMRPIAWIPTHGAKRTPENPTGLRQRFFDPEAGYRALLNELLSRPFDRFIIHQPAGWVEEKVGGKRMGGAQYWAIDDKHLRMWTRAIHDAMRLRPEITVGIYGSLSL